MPKIEHIALWVKDLEKMKDFYVLYFGAKAGEKYSNPKKQFSSYFLKFEDEARLELMHNPTIAEKKTTPQVETLGFIHLAVSVGSKEKVNQLYSIKIGLVTWDMKIPRN